VTCAACAHANRADARFCAQCGSPLVLACSVCGRQLPPGGRFCDGCGAPVGPPPEQAPQAAPRAYTPDHLVSRILTQRSSLEGERKQVTVLFADAVGSTALAERLDPESMRDVMDGCYRMLLEEVHRYEGTVNQFTGDGAMALFGAPIAHENAPERALRAALGIQAALRGYAEEVRARHGIDFRMRIGINTGLVVVGKIGDDLHMDYTAIGDTTNLAARLQTAAAPGSVLISGRTAKLVGGRFALRSVGPLSLKGKSRPVSAYEVLRALPRAPLVAPAENKLTPLIGRDHELTVLLALLGHARAGHGQVAFLVGEAGIGKSRLIHEFRNQIGDESAAWLVGRCVSYGRGIPLLPVIELVKSAFGIDEGDGESLILDKLQRGLAELALADDGVAPYLRSLLSLDPGDVSISTMDAAARHFATFEAVKRFLLASAARQPLVVLIEDLHWVDHSSDEFLTFVVDSLAPARIMLLCTHRPEHRPSFAQRSFVTRLALQPLTPEETGHMAAAMLAAHVPSTVQELIIRKAEGNPFFVEEVTKSLLEVGALRRARDGVVATDSLSENVIPDTIQGVIMARIDRLGEEPKRAIQVASVIGREFALRLLQRAAELGDHATALVGELRALELIYEKSGVPELAYMFKHALTHDVAYESLLLQRRKQLHRSIGLAVEELYADRLSEHWETLAHHFYRAEEWPRAFEYLVKAGDKAAASYANAAAIEFFDRALATATHLEVADVERGAILKAKGLAHLCVSQFPEATEAFRRALELETDPRERARLQAFLAIALWYEHEFDAALSVAREALGTAEGLDDRTIASQAHCAIGVVQMVRGQLDDAAVSFRAAACGPEVESDPLFGAWALSSSALQANWRGEYRAALERTEPLIDRLKQANQLWSLAQIASHHGVTLGGAGEYSRALLFLRESIALAESIGEKFWRARMWNTSGWIHGEVGAFDPAAEANHRCLEIAGGLGALRLAPELVGNARCNLADLALVGGNREAAEEHLNVVAAILGDPSNEWMTWRYGMHFHLTAAELCLARRELGKAREHVAHALATARRTHSRKYIVRGTRLLAACRLAEGDLAGAEMLLREALEGARRLGNPPQLWSVLLARARLLERLDRRDEAAAMLREAAALVSSVAGRLAPELQSTLRASPVARAVL
jgi:class 3 adenylate cyclase/tetratricopeptide (TPR) repeat protein